MIKKRGFKFELFLCGVVEVIGVIIAAPGLFILMFGNSISEYIYECKRRRDELVCDKAFGHLKRNCLSTLRDYFETLYSGEEVYFYERFIKKYNFYGIRVIGTDYNFEELDYYVMSDKLKELYREYDRD